MILRKTSLAVGIAAAAFTVCTASAAPFANSNAGAAVQPVFNAPTGGSVVLYDQTDSPGTNGFPAQNFETAYDAYDSEGADDFVVPAGGWTIDTVNLVTTTGTPGAQTASVNFYPDAGGQPGATATCSYAAAAANVGAASTTITLPAPCVLGTAGTYWVAVSVAQNFASNGQIFWSTRTVQSNNPAAWRNPGDGFASGCTDWGTIAACGVGGGIDPDVLFQIVGTAGGGGGPVQPARELPTLSQWGLMLGAAGLALLGLFGVRRRATR